MGPARSYRSEPPKRRLPGFWLPSASFVSWVGSKWRYRPTLCMQQILSTTVPSNSHRVTQNPESPLPIVLKRFPDPGLLSRTEPPY